MFSNDFGQGSGSWQTQAEGFWSGNRLLIDEFGWVVEDFALGDGPEHGLRRMCVRFVRCAMDWDGLRRIWRLLMGRCAVWDGFW